MAGKPPRWACRLAPAGQRLGRGTGRKSTGNAGRDPTPARRSPWSSRSPTSPRVSRGGARRAPASRWMDRERRRRLARQAWGVAQPKATPGIPPARNWRLRPRRAAGKRVRFRSERACDPPSSGARVLTIVLLSHGDNAVNFASQLSHCACARFRNSEGTSWNRKPTRAGASRSCGHSSDNERFRPRVRVARVLYRRAASPLPRAPLRRGLTRARNPIQRLSWRFIVKKSVIGSAIVLGFAVAIAAPSIGGCGSQGNSGSPGNPAPVQKALGTVGLELTLPGGETITNVNWTINQGATVVLSGTYAVPASATSISFFIPNVPSGSGYTSRSRRLRRQLRQLRRYVGSVLRHRPNDD